MCIRAVLPGVDEVGLQFSDVPALVVDRFIDLDKAYIPREQFLRSTYVASSWTNLTRATSS